MKKIQLILPLLCLVLLISSCSRDIQFAGHYKPNTDVAKTKPSVASHAQTPMQTLPVTSEVAKLEASSTEASPQLELVKTVKEKLSEHSNLSIKQKKMVDRKFDQLENKLAKHAAKEKSIWKDRELSMNISSKSEISEADNETILYALLALFIPPLAVALYEDDITSHFWIALLLTLLFFLPGVIYALVIILGDNSLKN